MLSSIRRTALRVMKAAGVFALVRDSKWRRQRLLILCYHGTSQEDEHQWRPNFYMPPWQLEERLQILKRGAYNVLPLAEGLRRLYANDLAPRSVALTFDDGTYDFYKQAYPLLKKYGFPATVYQTTYYVDHAKPVFNLMCSYVLWKGRGKNTVDARCLGLERPLDLSTDETRQAIVDRLVKIGSDRDLTASQKDEVLAQLAGLLDVDYAALNSKRILCLMNRDEISELARAGIDFQLHTHRHRTPRDQALFAREIRDNRERLKEYTGNSAVHFCYPSGVYQAEFLPWLREQQVISATTCDPGLAAPHCRSLVLPRYVDSSRQTPIEFEGWLTGAAELLMKAKGGRRHKNPEVMTEAVPATSRET